MNLPETPEEALVLVGLLVDELAKTKEVVEEAHRRIAGTKKVFEGLVSIFPDLLEKVKGQEVSA